MTDSGPTPTVATGSDHVRAQFRMLRFEIPQLFTVIRFLGSGTIPERRIEGFLVKPADAIATWEKLRAMTDRTGYYPLIFKNWCWSEVVVTANQREKSLGEILKQAEAIDGTTWFVEREMFMRKKYQGSLDEPPRERGDTGKTRDKFTNLYDASIDGFFMLLVPTRNPWEVPAYVPVAGGFDCPDEVGLVVALRHWHYAHGAEIVTAGRGGPFECRVAPVVIERRAERLALEMYWFCYESVEQEEGSIDALKDSLGKSSVWYFWWD